MPYFNLLSWCKYLLISALNCFPTAAPSLEHLKLPTADEQSTTLLRQRSSWYTSVFTLGALPYRAQRRPWGNFTKCIPHRTMQFITLLKRLRCWDRDSNLMELWVPLFTAGELDQLAFIVPFQPKWSMIIRGRLLQPQKILSIFFHGGKKEKQFPTQLHLWNCWAMGKIHIFKGSGQDKFRYFWKTILIILLEGQWSWLMGLWLLSWLCWWRENLCCWQSHLFLCALSLPATSRAESGKQTLPNSSALCLHFGECW